LLRAQAFELASGNVQFSRVVFIDAPIAQVDHHLLDFNLQVLREVCGLLQRGAQNVAVVGVAGKDASTQNETALMLVHDHTLKIFGLDGLKIDSGLNGGFDQRLQPLFAQGAFETANLRGVGGQTMLVVIHAAEKPPEHIFRSPRENIFIAEVKTVLEIEQAGQEANGQIRPTRSTHASTHDLLRWTPPIMARQPIALRGPGA
jgi:hypothetical protein